MDESVLEVGRLGCERQTVDGGKIREPGCCGGRRLDDSLAEGPELTLKRAVAVLASGESAAIDERFNLNGQGGLAGRVVDGGERSVVEVGERGVVIGEVAKSVAAADDGGGTCRECEADTRSYVVVLGWDTRRPADAINVGNLQCTRCSCSRVGERLQEVIVRDVVMRFGEGCEDVVAETVGGGAVEVKSATADLDAILGAKGGWSEGVDVVIGEACKEQVPIVQLMIDASVIGVEVLWPVRADGEVVAQVAIGGRRKQLQVLERDRVDGYRTVGCGNEPGISLSCPVGGGEQ
jgi:hypothetical protein